ncbi:uncharacterized protein LOC124414533 [Diprion similis]|uniref:uncharacterized protein LOC124414533 n=1 Tax=Diprion similis TaxID=362088 RepID=UPI001EF9329A|nr:uncharacterized protein LOC124414533 [Diprion similis]
MFLKIAIIAFAVSINTTSAGDDVWTGFVASWSNDSSHFYELPQTLESAQNQGWTNISGVEQPDGVAALGYESDFRFVILYLTETGSAIGVQVAIPAADVDSSGQPMEYANISAVTTKVLEGVECYTVTALFYIDGTSGARELWFLEKNGTRQMPTNASLITSEMGYYNGHCVPSMGNHYYPITTTTKCSSLNPWFILYEGENVIGFGFQGIGTVTSSSVRDWWESIPPATTSTAIPSDGPICLGLATVLYGITSVHIWLVDQPQNITCN